MAKTENREMRITRTFKAPVELLWEVWTDPAHIINWWGPNGFTTTIHKMDFKEEGEWNLTLHAPNGTNYPNKSIYKEIVLLKKIVFEHFNPHFFTTVLFESKGDETQVDWTMVFDNAEILETVVKVHKVDEGLKQNVEKLGEYLLGLLSKSED
ncbi:SRPBCC domain-containing protein [Mucilaginibacter sp. 22184]|uniref:SRPBCC domain-containing protein n=1 Tax=Mucilaginibacter sp. 22184 TaxID=3453887 RepID=UPI003F868766